MRLKAVMGILALLASGNALAQTAPQAKSGEERPIKISTELVQLDVVVTDKKGNIVTNLTKQDFEVHENGRKQPVSFFEFVDARSRGTAPSDAVAAQGPAAGDIRRIFAFVIDDLTIRMDDLAYIRQMLTNFVDKLMQPTDLVAIVRTVGGKGLLQQFTSDKELLRRAIAALTPRTHALAQFNNEVPGRVANRPGQLLEGGEASDGSDMLGGIDSSSGQPTDPSNPADDSNLVLRGHMSIGTASFVIDSMKQLPGRKSLVLISSGIPLFGPQANPEAASNVVYFLNLLADQATRAGVSIHTMDVQGLVAYRGVASFEETPGRSMVGPPATQASTPSNPTGNPRAAFGRSVDETLLGRDPIGMHQGLRVLASATGGIAVLKKNDFDEGLSKIVSASDGYYLVAYTPSDSKFDNKFRKVEVKVKGADFRVYSRRGYLAREEKASAEPATRQEQMLAAIKSPLAHRDINLDALVLYKAGSDKHSALDIHLSIDPARLSFEDAGGRKQADYEVAGFVFDELGKLRGGFSETILLKLDPAELKKAESTRVPYHANTQLPPGTYQIRLGVRDNKTGKLGTLSRFLEVPDLAKGRFYASSLLLGSVPAGDTKTVNPVPITANRRISNTQEFEL
jgi:VWFA-related protein